LDTLDKQHRLEALGDSALDEDNDHAITFDGHVKLGSPQRPVSIQELKNVRGPKDQAFQGFRKKLGDFVNTSLPTYRYELMRWIVLPVDFQVSSLFLCQLLRYS
jgi:hypothetical protein